MKVENHMNLNIFISIYNIRCTLIYQMFALGLTPFLWVWNVPSLGSINHTHDAMSVISRLGFFQAWLEHEDTHQVTSTKNPSKLSSFSPQAFSII